MAYSANDIIEKIGNLLKNKKQVVAAIDGRCASGKTSLAEVIAEQTGWTVFHMDDFFLRPEQRNELRLNTPGENIDHERFLEEILEPIWSGVEEVTFRPFDCGRMELGEPVSESIHDAVIVEGSYSCNRFLWDYYDFRVFVTVGSAEQLSRIVARSGASAAQRFRELWVPLEESYFSAFKIESRCDIVIDTSSDSNTIM